MRALERIKAYLLVVVLTPWMTSSLLAQEGGDLTFEAQGGVAIPAGALADIADVGATVGGSVGYQFHPNFGWRAGVEGIWLNDTRDAADVMPSPAMDIVHFMTGPEVVFPRPSYQDLPMTFRMFVAGGGATVNAVGSGVSFDHTYFVFSFGGAAGYQLSEVVNIFVDGRGYLFLFDEQDTLVFADRSPFVQPFAEGWVAPLTLGIRFRI